MKKYIYLLLLLILGGGGFFFFYEKETSSRFQQASEGSKAFYFGSFYQEQALSFFVVMERQIVLYEKEDAKKAIESYQQYMNWLHDYWLYNGNKINVFSDFIRSQYHSFCEKKLDSSVFLKKEDYPSEFWKWLDSPVRKKITDGDIDRSRDKLYQDLAARSLRAGFALCELYKKLNPQEASLDLGVFDIRRAMVRYSFLYYLLVRAGEIEKSPIYESAIFDVYRRSEGLGFSDYYKDPLPAPLYVTGKEDEFFAPVEKYTVPDAYAGMSERKYKKLVKEFLQFLKEGEEKEFKLKYKN